MVIVVNQSYWVFMTIVLFIVLIIDAFSPARAAVVVTPASVNTASASFWSGSILSSVGGSAVVSKAIQGTVTTAKGSAVALPANWTATIPRATLSASAANIIKRAGVYGLAAYSLYSLLSPAINLNSDGTINAIPDSYTYTYAAGTFGQPCYTTQNYSGTTASICSAVNAQRSTWYSCSNTSNFVATGAPSNGDKGYCVIVSNQTPVHTLSPVSGGTSPQSVTESDLASRIQSSSVASGDLFGAQLADINAGRGNGIDFGAAVVPRNTPTAVTASPVTGPAETISTATTPNPDGSTTTTTKPAQTTATPKISGNTAGDAALDWETSTTTTTTAHNNTTGQDQVSTETTNNGTTTTAQPQPESDLCKLHPDIAACAQLGSVPTESAVAVQTHDVAVNFTAPSSVAGSCPAPVQVEIHPPYIGTRTLSISYQPICNVAGWIRYITLALAWLMAGFIVTGSNRRTA